MLGASILAGSGTAAVAAPAKNRRNAHWFDQLSSSSKEELSGAQAWEAWHGLSKSEHMGKLAAVTAARTPALSLLAENVRGIAVSEEPSQEPTVKAVRHRLVGGGSMVAVSHIYRDVVTAAYVVTTKSGATRRFTRMFQVSGQDTTQLIAEADDGVATDIVALREDQAGTMAGDCPDCMSRRCDEQNWGCVQSCCYGCAFACGNIATCLACAAIGCPWCVSLNCCNRSSCYPIVRCGPY